MVSQRNLALIGLIGLFCVVSMGILLKNAEQFAETAVTNGQVIVGSQAEADIVLKDLPLNGQVLISNIKNNLSEDDDAPAVLPTTVTSNNAGKQGVKDEDEDEEDDDSEDEEDDDSEDDSEDEYWDRRRKRKRWKHPKNIDDGSPWLMYPSLNLLELQNPPPTTTAVPKTTATPSVSSTAPPATTTSPPTSTSSPPPTTTFAPLPGYAIRLANPQPNGKSITVYRDQQQSAVMSPTTTAQPTASPAPIAPQPAALPSTPETLPDTPYYEGTEVFLDNGIMRVGFDLERGAALFYVASKADNDYKGVNLINDYDCGRMIQQSYYGREDGTIWPFPSGPKKWRWNPVQAGNYLNVPSVVKAWTNEIKKNCFTSYTTPRHWVTGDVLNEVQLKQDVCLQGDTVRITFKMTYNGTVAHPLIDQELPPIYMWKGLSRLVLYDGDKPWKKDDLTSIDPPISVDVIPSQSYAMENWAAYVSKEHGWGLGVLFPHTNKISYYLVNSSASGPEGCSYLAPIVPLEIVPGFQAEYDIFLVTGTIQEIREKIYGIKNKYSMFE
jgi:hypothetical protein